MWTKIEDTLKTCTSTNANTWDEENTNTNLDENTWDGANVNPYPWDKANRNSNTWDGASRHKNRTSSPRRSFSWGRWLVYFRWLSILIFCSTSNNILMKSINIWRSVFQKYDYCETRDFLNSQILTSLLHIHQDQLKSKLTEILGKWVLLFWASKSPKSNRKHCKNW